jgi:hypothetical protein
MYGKNIDMSTECKANCKLQSTRNKSLTLIWGKSAGRKWTYSTHKYCSVCEYWISLKDNKDINCFCCGIKYRNRKQVTENNRIRRTRRNNDLVIRIEQIFRNHIKCLQQQSPTPILVTSELYMV